MSSSRQQAPVIPSTSPKAELSRSTSMQAGPLPRAQDSAATSL